MSSLSDYQVHVFDNDNPLPPEAEDFYREELAGSLEPLSEFKPDRDGWRFSSICAIAKSGQVIGGVHIDMGPRNFGPLAADRIAFVEHTIVRPEYRRYGLGTRLLQEAIEIARAERCQCVRCNVSWANPAEIALFTKCGFALACIEDGEYFAAKPLQGYGCDG
jgi:ribosomal protein S18 acetylase RimI-like enzyme